MAVLSEAGPKLDLVNSYFRQFYPADWKENWSSEWCVGNTARRHCGGARTIFPEMVCADGFKLSVQGHFGAYSYPRDDFAVSYLQVECLGPKQADELLSPFERECNAIGDDEMIYPYVPVEVIVALIEKHGGLSQALGDVEPDSVAAGAGGLK